MKLYTNLILTFCIGTILSCNQFKSDHPQSEILDQNATDLTAKSILNYTDGVDQKLATLSKQTSLVYRLGELSFYVEKYNENGKTVAIREHAFNGLNSNSLRSYYFKNDSLLLEKTNVKLDSEDEASVKETRTFLRNNTIFKTDERTGTSANMNKSNPFLDLPLSKSKNSDKEFLDKVKSLNDVVAGNDKFNMVFDTITSYPDSHYILLKSKLRNAYTSTIVVKENDAFVDSLINNPTDFKNKNLKLQWKIVDQEAIYQPLTIDTSARGLKR